MLALAVATVAVKAVTKDAVALLADAAVVAVVVMSDVFCPTVDVKLLML
jgi:hypothetical protein